MREPDHDCPLCPRLLGFRDNNRGLYPDWHNAPVPSFASENPWLLIVGLAPGLRGANRTGRPFTGDYAGDLLFRTLCDQGLAEGTYGRERNDGLHLIGCRITNAVRCVPPANKPTPAEIRVCAAFLRDEIGSLPGLRAMLALGAVAHHAVLTALDVPRSGCRFVHGALHRPKPDLVLADSYHCSRQNTNTGRLTAAMFAAVFDRLREALASA